MLSESVFRVGLTGMCALNESPFSVIQFTLFDSLHDLLGKNGELFPNSPSSPSYSTSLIPEPTPSTPPPHSHCPSLAPGWQGNCRSANSFLWSPLVASLAPDTGSLCPPHSWLVPSFCGEHISQEQF